MEGIFQATPRLEFDWITGDSYLANFTHQIDYHNIYEEKNNTFIRISEQWKRLHKGVGICFLHN